MLREMVKITLFGVGCLKYKTMLSQVQKALEELVLDAVISESDISIEEIEDIESFIRQGLNNIPVVAINGQLITAGVVPSVEDLKKSIKNQLPL